jgi:hypothetical protein
MNQFINDLKTLVKNNWRVILWVILISFLISNYEQIKVGVIDGWNNK